jgi:hypothetical protein
MCKSTPRIAVCLALLAVLGVVMPTVALAAGRGGGHGGGAGHAPSVHARGAPARAHVQVHRSAVPAAHVHGGSGPLSYNAFWRAATSPNPPSTSLSSNRYWQEMQAWQMYHPR